MHVLTYLLLAKPYTLSLVLCSHITIISFEIRMGKGEGSVYTKAVTLQPEDTLNAKFSRLEVEQCVQVA